MTISIGEPNCSRNKIAVIYAIRNTASARPGALYVGSTVRPPQKRWTQHLTRLRQGKHHSSRLQAAYARYGEAAFEFAILEQCEPGARFGRETFWLGALGARYNVAPVGGSVAGLRWSLSPATREKMSIAARNRSEEHKQKLREARARQPRKARPLPKVRKGRKFSDAHRQALSEAAKRRSVSEEQLALLRTVNLGRQYSAETRARRSAGVKAAHERDPTLRERLSAIRKAYWERRRQA